MNNPVKKWAHELNRDFSKEQVQMANKYMKKCSITLRIKEIQIKTTLTFHLTPVRMIIIKHTQQILSRMWQNRNPYILLLGM
jgi:hypothetical protein